VGHHHQSGLSGGLIFQRVPNLLTAFDMADYAKARYNLLGQGGHWFPGQQAGDIDRWDFSKCLARSPHAQKIPKLLVETHRRLGGETVRRLSQS